MAAAAAGGGGAKDDEVQSLVDPLESSNSRPSTADRWVTPAAADEPGKNPDELGKTPTSSRAASEQTVQPFGSE